MGKKQNKMKKPCYGVLSPLGAQHCTPQAHTPAPDAGSVVTRLANPTVYLFLESDPGYSSPGKIAAILHMSSKSLTLRST